MPAASVAAWDEPAADAIETESNESSGNWHEAAEDAEPFGADDQDNPFGDSPSAASPFEAARGWGNESNSGEASVDEQDEQAEESAKAEEPSNPWSVKSQEGSAWATESHGEASETPQEEYESNGEQSPFAAEVEPAPAEESVSAPEPKPQPTSFIERYAHMFADESASEPSAVAPSPSFGNKFEAPKPRSEAGAFNTRKSDPLAGDQEESVEQYMAKLLQRVRGGSFSVAAEAAAIGAKPVATTTQQERSESTPVADSANAVEAAAADEQESTEDATEDAKEVAVNWEAIARRGAASDPASDLNALRALANDSARRAISHHQSHKHRRNAVTKVIVSTLAGMTSLWLMLLAPSWTDLQFIAACVSLVIAAYWAGDTFCAMLKAFRAASYDGPDEGEHALPIDTDGRLKSV
jgi:hypothetical protein